MMSNGKVYLSKSNRANPDYVMLVRRHIESLGYEILEHRGGDYDHDLMFRCRYMVMIGQASASGGETVVGKGQYEQLLKRRNRSTNYYHLYFTHTDDDGNPVFKGVTNGGVLDADNWTTGYGKLMIKMNSTRKLRPFTRPEQPRPQVQAEEQFYKDSDTAVVVSKKTVHLACITLLS
jgi:hypothetical protein